MRTFAFAKGLHRSFGMIAGAFFVVIAGFAGSAHAAPDVTAPAAVTDLAPSAPTFTSLTLSWTAPADDLSAPSAMTYDIRYSTARIRTDADFDAATPMAGEPTPAAAGTRQTMEVTGLASNAIYYFAMKTTDAASNVSALSNAPGMTTRAMGTTVPVGGSSTDLVLRMYASPTRLPAGGGRVTFTYGVTNQGPNHISDVSVTDSIGAHGCSPVTYVSGDKDFDGLIESYNNETWVFTCVGTTDHSSSHTAIANGTWNAGRGTSNTASVTILVGDATASANAHFHAKPYPTVTHAGVSTSIDLRVGNLGLTPISGVAFSGGECAVSDLLSGDDDGDGLLGPGEEWKYVCVGTYSTSKILDIVFAGQAGDVRISDVDRVAINVDTEELHGSVHMHVAAAPAALPKGGGTTQLTYHVSNDGNIPLTDVMLESGSETCVKPAYEGGDVGQDGVLAVGEQWIYSCVEALTHSEADAAVVTARAGNQQVTDDALFVIPVATTEPPAADVTVSTSYGATDAMVNNPDIDTSLGLAKAAGAQPCIAGVSYKAPSDGNPKTAEDSTVYYCGRDGLLHEFPNAHTFLSWYPDFASVAVMPASALRAIPIGTPVTYRPGVRLLKTATDPKVYAVARGGILRWIVSEDVAVIAYGGNWKLKIDDVPAQFLQSHYHVGSPIDAAAVGAR